MKDVQKKHKNVDLAVSLLFNYSYRLPYVTAKKQYDEAGTLISDMCSDRTYSSVKKRALVRGYNYLQRNGNWYIRYVYDMFARMLEVPNTVRLVYTWGMKLLSVCAYYYANPMRFGFIIVHELNSGPWIGARAAFAYNVGLFHSLYGEPFHDSAYGRTVLHCQTMVDAENYYKRTKLHHQRAVFAWLWIWKHNFKGYFPREIAREIAEYVWRGRFEGI